MLICLEAIWPSLKRYPNSIPASVGTTSNMLIAYAIFWIRKFGFSVTLTSQSSNPVDPPSPRTVQFPLVMIHPRKMRWLFFVKSVVAVVASFALLGWAVNKAGGGGPIFAQKSTLTGSTKSWAWVAGINIAISGKTTLAINIVSVSNRALDLGFDHTA